jgi:7,8-dihydropterin-6-yl-methyl-4-(beta-D-ribofuranosyl)aminobenzene 5'-phosphate synthase
MGKSKMIDSLKVTVLSENNSENERLHTEHGLSFFIEINNIKILFDTGASDCFMKNAKQFGIDLNKLDYIVLSHGHYDHIGGLKHLQNKTVYVHPHIFRPKYKKEDSNYKHTGFDLPKSHYENNNKLKFIEIFENTSLTPEIKLLVNFKKVAIDKFFIKNQDIYLPDLFTDEIAITINTKKGLVVITGCAHSGILNILDKAIEDSKTDNIYALLGGFHLSNLNETKIKEIADKINNYKINKIGISHCTGNKMEKYLANTNTFQFNVGNIFE